jgi:pyrroline-5-carboxylate reductase
MAGKVILVGCGNMGFAMLKGWLASGAVQPADVLIIEPNNALRDRAAGQGVRTSASSDGIAGETADLVIIAVKPQVLRDVLPAYKALAPKAAFLSIAAGIAIRTFTEILGDSTPVIRCMPNTPAAIGKGMMGVYANEFVSSDILAFVNTLLSASGEVAMLDNEGQIDAVTAVSGSGPAYVFHFIECLEAAAVKAGLSEKVARLLAMQTVYGAANLAKESGEEPGRLREQVTSPNGTTAAALAVLMGENRLGNLVDEAVDAARRRSIELGK